MDEELFLTWFEEIFVLGISHVRPTLLIMDGHGSHISYNIIKRAVEENIKIILLPPHTTNVLQPLDVGLFRYLKVNLSKVTDGVKMLSVTGDCQNINKTNFTAIFKESFERSMSLSTIKNGFRKTGICPFNPEAIDKTRLIPLDNNNTPSSSLPQPIPTATLLGVANMESITPLYAPSATEDLEKSNSDLDFNIHSIEEAPPLPRSIENILVRMNIVPQYLADMFYLPPGKRNQKTYKPRVTTVARRITDEVHQKMYKEKQESTAKKEKEKEDRKRARKRKQEIKLLQGNNKKIRKQ